MSTAREAPPAVLVTGSSTGIGAACVRELDRRGFRVFAGVRSEADADRLKADCSPRVVPLRLDVTKDDDIAAAAETIRQGVGDAGLAGLVNNAGVAVAGPLEILPLEELRRQFEVNVIGLIAVTRAMLPLVRRARGRIVNISSLNGRIASPYLGPYCASKHAVEALSDALRIELRGWGIRVAVVQPGKTSTPIWEKSLAASDALSGEASPEDLALYKADLAAFRGSMVQVAATAQSVDATVRAVLHALTARRPKVRYPIGLEVKLLFRVFKWVPDRLWDWILRRALGLPA
ncbi:MAG: SDR family NAD(P)-dependent oxidoreductase [Thermoguttaceae bacterium]|jgi:NAD(P)-dependent dehydrogenase (short-subunit alcohol dehydrogenase family)